MSAFIALRGKLVVVGKSPDGDSMRFVAGTPQDFAKLAFAHRLRMSVDGSVQLRFEAIDAPETHYEHLAQPLGDQARDALLKLAGFSHITFTKETVQSATPLEIPAVIVAKMIEVNGRPVAYIFTGSEPNLHDGQPVTALESFLPRSLNMHMLDNGLAYLTLYTSTLPTHRAICVQHAQAARSKRIGVWAKDTTKHFTLANQQSIGPAGELVLPKIFRRCSDYLRAQQGGFAGNLAEWLISTSQSAHNENDLLELLGKTLRLSDIITEQGDTVQVAGDTLDMIFVEK